MPRIFIALPAGDDVIAFFRPIHEFLQRFKGCLSVVPGENYHITLKFYGDCTEDTQGAIEDGFRAMGPLPGRIPVKIRGLGTFPDMERARVIWSGLDMDAGPVNLLLKMTDDFSSPLGFPPEKRGFTPHLTLARVKRERAIPRELMEYLRSNVRMEFLESAFDRITLFESLLGSGGAKYRELHSISLKG